MKASVVYNAANFIRSSVQSVYEALLEAILFVCSLFTCFCQLASNDYSVSDDSSLFDCNIYIVIYF